MHKVSVNVPTAFSSKILAVTEYANGRRKVQISSNLLPINGFEKGTPVFEKSMGYGQGYVVELAEDSPLFAIAKPKHIYQRTYKRRRNNPFEETFETSSQKLLDVAIEGAKFVRVVISYGKMEIKPLIDRVATRISQLMKAANPFTVFGACTSGVDLSAAESVGYEINSVLEYRPRESRDKAQDFTETGAITALANVKIKHLINEDITEIDTEFVAQATADAPSTVLLVSPQCDEFSNLKAESLKQASLENADSTLDMVHDILNLNSRLRFPVVVLEQVPAFGTSVAGKMYDLRMRKLGYKTSSQTVDMREHNGTTTRTRYFHVATLLNSDFAFPSPIPATSKVWDRLIEGNLHRFRDVTHTQGVQLGLKTGRIRLIKRDKPLAPTIFKSQSRQVKDSVYIETSDGRYLFPDEQLLKELMEIPDDFDLSVVSSSIATEIIGQAVDYRYYARLMESVKTHIAAFLGLGENPVSLTA